MDSPRRLVRPWSSSPVTISISSSSASSNTSEDDNLQNILSPSVTSAVPVKPGQICECGYRRTPDLIRYDCTTTAMANERSAFLLATLLLAAMFAIHRAFLPLSYTDFNFTLALLLYVPLLNAAILRCGPTSTAAPAANRLVLRLLFIVTFFCSLLAPAVFLVLFPPLAATGMARHLWLVLSQLLLESASFSISQHNEISALVRIISTAACIMYRLPVARSWWLSNHYDTVDLGTYHATATTLCRTLAAANFFYWGSCLFWYIIPLALNSSSIPVQQKSPTDRPARGAENSTRKRPVAR